jgi:endonuclease YncB( thermonuclease family)
MTRTAVLVVVLAALAYALSGLPGSTEPPARAAATPLHTQRGRVLFVADGDTLRARLSDGSVRLIRFTGINAPEVHTYKVRTAQVRGDCQSVAALRLVRHLLPVGSRVDLLAQNMASETGSRHRLRRLVWRLRSPHNIAAEELRRGLALWLPNRVENDDDPLFRSLAQRALSEHIGMYNPFACQGAPQPEDQPYLHLFVHPDAYGNDRRNLNDEYISLSLDPGAPAPLRLGGWFVRDSALRRPLGPVPGLPFPPDAVLTPGQTVAVRVGCGPSNTPGEYTGGSLYWCDPAPMFENSGDGGYLFDPVGNLRAGYIY